MSLYGCYAGTVRRECNDCSEEELSKIVHVAFVLSSELAGIDKTSPNALITDILDLERTCKAYVIRNTSGTYDGGAYTEGKGPGKQTSRITGGTHTISITDFDYTNNVEFWNKFKYISGNYNAIYFTDTYAWIINRPLTIIPTPSLVEDSTATIGENAIVQIKWQSKDNPVNYKANVDALAQCLQLFDYSLLSWTQGSGSMAIIDGDTITAAQSAGIRVILNTSVDLAGVEVVSGSIPAGLSISASGQIVEIIGAGTVLGTSDLTLRVYNSCGVATELDVVIVIE